MRFYIKEFKKLGRNKYMIQQKRQTRQNLGSVNIIEEEEQWVLGGIVQRQIELFFVPGEDRRTEETFLDIIQSRLEKGSTIIKDC